VNDGQPAATGRFATQSVSDALYNDALEGLTLKRGKCFGKNDPVNGKYLGRAPRGCLAESYDASYRSIYALKMYPNKNWGRWNVRGIRYIASS